MKRRIFSFWLGVLCLSIVMIMGGCEDVAGDKDKGQEWVLSLSVQSVVLPASGGSQNVSVATNDENWRLNVRSEDNWCHVEQRKNEVVIQLEAHKSSESRKTTVQVVAGEGKSIVTKEIEVLQLGVQLTIRFDPEALAFTPQGGTRNVNVLAEGQKWEYTVMAGETWCHVVPYENTLIVNADPNRREEMREALIVVGIDLASKNGDVPVQATLKVQQEGLTPTLNVSEDILSFASGLETRALIVVTNQLGWDVHWEESDWCSYEKKGDQLFVSVTPNMESKSRKTTLKVVAGELIREVMIVQAGVAPQLEAMPTTLEFQADGGMQTVSVLTNLGSWKARSDNPEWCEAVVGDRTLNVIVASYSERGKRQATIVLEAGEGENKKQATVLVSQIGVDVPIPELPIAGTWLLVLDSVQCTYTFMDQGKVRVFERFAGMVLINNSSYELNDKQLSIGDETYTMVSMDSTTMKWRIGGEEMALKRQTKPSLILSKQQAEVDEENSTDEVVITCNTIWGMGDSPDWLSVEPLGGMGDGKLKLTAMAPPTNQPRQATLTFYAGDQQKTLIVTQKAVEIPALEIDPVSLQVEAGETTRVVKVNSNAPWSVMDIPGWITVKPMSGQGNGSISLTVAANGKSQAREATLKVATDEKEVTLHVAQEALPETLEVDQANFDITAAGSEETIRLTSSSSWEISNVPDWITFSPSKGQQSGVVKMVVAANTGETSRSARISVKSGSKSLTLLVGQVAVRYYDIPLRFTGEALGCGQVVPNKHLFAVQVMSRVKNSKEVYQPYGYGLFDDSASIRVNLPDAYEYKIYATLVLDGKARIFRGSGFAAPVGNGLFTGTADLQPTGLNNQWILDASRGFIGISKGSAQLSDGKMYERPDIHRYYGEVVDWSPVSDAVKNVEMKSVVFGLSCEVLNIPQGNIRIELDGAPIFRFGKNEGYQGEKVFSFANSSGGWIADGYSETGGVRVVLEEVDGSSRTLHYQKVKFVRNQLSKLTAKYSDGGYTFTWETQPMEDKNVGDFNGNVWW